MTRSSTLDENAAEMLACLKWYADTFCEWGINNEECGKLSEGECSGCKARATISRVEQGK